MRSVCPIYQTKRYLLPPQGIIEDFEVEFLFTDAAVSLYINILQRPLFQEDKIIEVTYQSENLIFQTSAILLEGGQKICFPPDATEQILLLLENSSVHFRFGCYELTAPPFRITN